jgi:hypothetical protein
MEEIHNIVYSKQVIEFVAVSNEFCVLVENASKISRKEFIDKAHKILPLLYLKATLLPTTENQFDDFLDKYVSEEIYATIKETLEHKLGQYDAYTDVFNEEFQYSEEAVASSISEDLSDIYQDIKDFLMTFSSSTEELMNDAIWECSNNFKLYWGQRLTNSLRALHNVMYGEKEIEEEDTDDVNQEKESLDDIDTNSWIISQRQNDFQSGVDYNMENPED